MSDDNMFDMGEDNPAAANEELIEKAPPWLLSFGDVTALMLTFFVMLFSMSHLQSEKWDAIVSIVSTTDRPTKVERPTPVSEKNIDSISFVNALPPEYLMRVLKEKLARDEILSTVPVSGLDEQVIISLPADQFFDDNSDRMKTEMQETLSRLTGALRQIGNQVDIQGHAGPSTIGTNQETPWGLSLARALAFSERIKELGYEGRLTVLGLGPAHFRHLDENLSLAERQRWANRIDLVILPDAQGQ